MNNPEAREQAIEAAAIQYWANIAYDDVHIIANPCDFTTEDIDGLSWYELSDCVKERIRDKVETTV